MARNITVVAIAVMALLGLLLSLLQYGGGADALVAPGGIPPYETHYYDQTIDHFNFRTTGLDQVQTYKQRYLVYAGAWDKSKEDSPIFFYTGNEGDIVSFYNNTGFVFDIAPAFGALVIFGEHRYYGESLPFGNNSWDLSKIGYLSVEQALADFAELLTALKEQYNIPKAKVIAFGGSYGGMLTAWMRIKYPHIVAGGLAASAPIPVSSGFTSAPGYFETVTNDFAAANPRCPGLVRQAFSKVLKLAAGGSSGLAQLTQAFKLCKPLQASQVEHLILWVVNSFGTLAMMDYPYPTNFEAPLPGFPIREACNMMLNNTDLVTGLAQAGGLFYGNSACNDIYSEFVECADQTGCGTGPAGQSWDYQVCTEVLYYPNTNNVTDMFPPRNWTAADRAAYCAKTWGVIPRAGWLTTEFGASRITAASNIIFSNGLLDPWHGGGFLQSLSPTLPSVIIVDGAHHLDLRGSNPNDPASVIEARKKEVAYIHQFLASSSSH